MKIVVITDEAVKKELLAQSAAADLAGIEYAEAVPLPGGADVYIDLLFDGSPERLSGLQQLKAECVIVHSVIHPLAGLPENFIRINGWPSFLKRNTVEASVNDEGLKTKAEKAFASFNKAVEWTADMPGFVTARVISMIINEAYFALEEGVSTKEEIDIAMKLGTNYPYGPFEWGRLIGLKNIFELLKKLSQTNPRYAPASLLQKEALAP